MVTPAFSFPAPAFRQIEQWSGEAERITVTVRGQQATSGRRTARLQRVVWRLGYPLGGEAGTRPGRQSAIPLSPDTLLRRLRQTPVPAWPVSRALGVGDWAYRRGHHDGVMRVDLES